MYLSALTEATTLPTNYFTEYTYFFAGMIYDDTFVYGSCIKYIHGCKHGLAWDVGHSMQLSRNMDM